MPDEAVMPIARAIYEATTGLKPGDELYEDDGYAYHWEEAINTLAAVLNAWPNGEIRQSIQKPHDTTWYPPYIRLPLPQVTSAAPIRRMQRT